MAEHSTPLADCQHPAAADPLQCRQGWYVTPFHALAPLHKRHVLTRGPCAAVKHMAASLGVEWAKKGVRVNTLRYVYDVTACLRSLTGRSHLYSPGYMLTKLTRTILAHDQELKVQCSLALLVAGHMLSADPVAGL